MWAHFLSTLIRQMKLPYLPPGVLCVITFWSQCNYNGLKHRIIPVITAGMKFGIAIVAILTIVSPLESYLSNNAMAQFSGRKRSNGPEEFSTYPVMSGNPEKGETKTMSTTVTEWGKAVLTALGKATDSDIKTDGDNLTAMCIWAQWEGGGINNTAKNNVLNTTEQGFSEEMLDGLPAYPTLVDGINATVATLVQRNFEPIVKAFQNQELVENTLMAIQLSAWSANHYYYKLTDTEYSEEFAVRAVSTDTLPVVTVPPIVPPVDTPPVPKVTGTSTISLGGKEYSITVTEI